MSEITEKIIIMFVIMGVGVICGKTGLVTSEQNKGLSSLLLYVVSPVITFLSYQRDFSRDTALNLLLVFLLSCVAFVLMIFLANILIGKKRKDRELEILCSVLSNCAFMGIPVVESIFGSEGIIYLTMYITVFQLVTWTYGVSLLTGEKSISQSLRHLFTPAVISVFLGLIFFFCEIRLPQIITAPLEMVGEMNTPLAMLAAGVALAGTSLKGLLAKPGVFYISALRLVGFPAVCSLLAALAVKLGAGEIPAAVTVIAAGCPTAIVNVNFALKYEKNSAYAAEIFAVTTVLCGVTIPLLLKFLSLLGVG